MIDVGDGRKRLKKKASQSDVTATPSTQADDSKNNPKNNDDTLKQDLENISFKINAWTY